MKAKDSRRHLAIDFIRKVRTMDRETLHELIVRHVGEDLAQFFLAYANDLMEREPGRARENASSLLIIGYLIRCFEQDLHGRTVALESPFLH
jgi:hypothetical protein